ncbi:MAG: hypothetical protein CL912_18235 [Deltaproteobacteria bacterium]|nr:hypothetical protein [Deltaproteobacteria bacterium]
MAPRKPIGTKKLNCKYVGQMELPRLVYGVLTAKTKKTLAIPADLFDVGKEVAIAKANIQLPILLIVSLMSFMSE